MNGFVYRVPSHTPEESVRRNVYPRLQHVAWTFDHFDDCLYHEAELPAVYCRTDDTRQSVEMLDDGIEARVWPEAMPGPADLLRPEQQRLNGFWMQLEDGNEWLFPRLMVLTEGGGRDTLLPESLALRRGEQVRQISARWRPLWERTLEIEEAMCWGLLEMQDVPTPEDQPRMDSVELLTAIVEAWAVNYRIGIEEANLLGIFTTENLFDAARLMLGWENLELVIQRIDRMQEGLAGKA